MPDALVPAKFRRPVDSDAVANNWLERGYSCHQFNDPPGQEWNDFVHETNELVTVVEGRLVLVTGDLWVTVEPADEAFIPKGALHSVKISPDQPTSWLFGYDG